MQPLSLHSHLNASHNLTFSSNVKLLHYLPVLIALYEPANTEKTGLELKGWFLVEQGEFVLNMSYGDTKSHFLGCFQYLQN